MKVLSEWKTYENVSKKNFTGDLMKTLTICKKNLCNEVHTTLYKKQERERAENSYFS